MKTYRIAKGYRVYAYLTLSTAIIVATVCLIQSMLEKRSFEHTLIISLIMLLADVAMIIVLAIIHKNKVTISEDDIQLQGLFINQTLKRNEVKGFLNTENAIFIIPKNKALKKLEISKYYQNFKHLQAWLQLFYTDLTHVLAEIEEEEVLKDEKFGDTEAARKTRLYQARSTAKWLNWLSYGSMAIVFFFYDYLSYVIWLPFFLPIAAIGAMIYFKGLITLDESDGNITSNVAAAIFFPPCTLALAAILKFNIVSYQSSFFYTLATGFICAFAILRMTDDFRPREGKSYVLLLCFTLVSTLYTLGSTILINCLYDFGQYTPHYVEVLDKETEYDDRTIYRLELAAWELMPEITEQEVKRSVYEHVEIGEEVKVYYKDGLLGIPWIVIQ